MGIKCCQNQLGWFVIQNITHKFNENKEKYIENYIEQRPEDQSFLTEQYFVTQKYEESIFMKILSNLK